MKSTAFTFFRVGIRNRPSRLAATCAICVALPACSGGDGGERPLETAGASDSQTSAAATVDAQQRPGTTGARISWNAAPDSKVIGYRLYYGTESRRYEQQKGDGLEVGNVNAYVVQELSRGRTYHFAVTAIDDAGGESDYSEEARYPVR